MSSEYKIGLHLPGGPDTEAKKVYGNHYEAPRFGGGYWLVGEYPGEGSMPETVNGMWVEVGDEDENEATFVVHRSGEWWNIRLREGSFLFGAPRSTLLEIEVSEIQASKTLILAKDRQYFFDMVNQKTMLLGQKAMVMGNVVFQVGKIPGVLTAPAPETADQ